MKAMDFSLNVVVSFKWERHDLTYVLRGSFMLSIDCRGTKEGEVSTFRRLV